MKLSDYDRAHCLFVDRRFNRERGRIYQSLIEKGVDDSKIKMFVDGRGELLHPTFYDQISPTPPQHWAHGPGAYAHFMGMQAIIQKAKDDGIETLLFVEDDCVLTDEFDEVVEAATEQLQGRYWDILYYGANHTWAKTEILSPNVLRCLVHHPLHGHQANDVRFPAPSFPLSCDR